MSPSRGRKSHSASPKRKPLHERSPSQNNARSLSSRSRPSIRIVEDDSWILQSKAYNKSPLPSTASQILAPGYAQVSSSTGSVSDLRTSSSASNATSFNDSLIVRPLQPRKAARASGSTNFSQDDTLVNASSTFFKRQSPSIVTPTSPSFPEDSIFAEKLGSSDEGYGAGSRYSTIRPVGSSPSTSVERPRWSEDNTAQPEASPATSSSSLKTLTARNRNAEDTDSTNYEVFASSPIRTPEVSSYRGLQHASSAKKLPKPIFPPQENTSRQSLSDFSFVSSYISIDEPLRSPRASTDQPETLQSAIASGLTVQYPVIPSRSSSASRASNLSAEDLSEPFKLSPSPHALERSAKGPGASQPTTIHTETQPGESQSNLERSSGGTIAQNRATTTSIGSSALLPPSTVSSEVSVAIPAPLFQRNGRAFTPDLQELQESDDTVPELQSPHLRTVRSNRSFFSVFSGAESRPSSASESVLGSIYERASYMESNFFPAWARSYYRRGSTSLPTSESTTSLSTPCVPSSTPTSSRVEIAIRPATPRAASRTPSLDYVPATLYSPRKRPRQQPQQQQHSYRPPTTESVISFVEPDVQRPLPPVPAPTGSHKSDNPAQPKGPRPPPKTTQKRAPSVVPSQRSGLRSPIRRTASGHFTWAPRLAQDRRSVGVLSAWPAPSLASSMGGLNKLFGKRGNRQIALFVLGFAVPFAWMLAAFLPLPEQPPEDEEGGGVSGQHTREQAWRNSRLLHTAQLGGTTVTVDREGHGEDAAHERDTEARSAIATEDQNQALSEPHALGKTAIRDNSNAQMQVAFMQSWFSGELEKIEIRRRYVKARWWRRLNRVMAVIGLLILGAIAALIVVALKYHL